MASVRELLSEAAVGDLTVHTAGDQRYVVSQGPDAVYVAFQGTQHLTDWAVNLRFNHAPLWRCGGGGKQEQREPLAAHGGFSRRSEALPLLELREVARSAGKRLVLCGHSLGGAVAMLGAVALLRECASGAGAAPSGPRGAELGGGGGSAGARAGASCGVGEDPLIRCVTFAAPPVANEALAAEVAALGWDRYISNFVLPEDPVVPVVNRLLRAESADSHPGSALLDKLLPRLQQLPGALLRAGSGGASGAPGASAPLAAMTWGAAGAGTPGAAAAAASTAVTKLLQMLLADSASEAADEWLMGETIGVDGAGAPAPSAAHGTGLRAAAGAAALAAVGARSRRLGGFAAMQVGGRRTPYRLNRWSHEPLAAGQPYHQPQRLRQQAPRALWQLQQQQQAAQEQQQAAAGPAQRQQRPQAQAAQAPPGGRWPGALGQLNARRAVAEAFGHASGLGAARPGAMVQAARVWMHQALSARFRAGVRNGLRAAALAAPLLLPALTPQGTPLLGRLLPAAVGLELFGSALLSAVVPRTCPIGSQWVLSPWGLELADRPISQYPRQPEELGLSELGGLFPGHRMVAYRNRLAHLGRSAGGAGAAAADEAVGPAPAAAGAGGAGTAEC